MIVIDGPGASPDVTNGWAYEKGKIPISKAVEKIVVPAGAKVERVA